MKDGTPRGADIHSITESGEIDERRLEAGFLLFELQWGEPVFSGGGKKREEKKAEPPKTICIF